MINRRSKSGSLATAVSHISSGNTMALGGNVNNNVAMAGVREIIRQGITDLTLIAFGQGIGADLLIGAGCVRAVHTNYIGMEHLGLAPAFRRAAETQTIAVHDWDSLGMILGLSSAAAGSPFAVLPSGIEVTCWPEVSADLYRPIVDPFTGSSHYAIPSLKPDVSLLYASRADEFGNSQYEGFSFWDEVIAQASDKTVVICEEIVGNDVVRASPELTVLPAYLVTAVAASPYAALPAGAPPNYAQLADHLAHYVQTARSAEGMRAYLADIRACDESTYVSTLNKGRS